MSGPRGVVKRPRHKRLRDLGYTAEQAQEIATSRSRLMARGFDLASKRRQQCVTGRIAHESQRFAKAVSVMLNMSTDETEHHRKPYECTYCQQWHLRDHEEIPG